MLRVVLDTNITASIFTKPDGRSAQIWQTALEGRFQIISSSALLSELGRVLRAKFAFPVDEVHRILRSLARRAEIVQPGKSLTVITADPSDNRILECAEAGHADLIVSNDHHLLDLKTFGGIPIIVGPDFRRILGLK